MGRVFTPKQLQANDIPTRADFDMAVACFQDAVQYCMDEGSVVGGVIYGSVGARVPRPRSDLDGIVVCTNAKTLDRSRFITSQTYLGGGGVVPAHVTAYTEESLRMGRHEIDPYFGRHITEDKRYAVGTDIASVISYQPRNPADIVNDFIRHKKWKLSESYTAQGHERDIYSTAERLFTLPLALGRKLMSAVADIEQTGRTVRESANKTTVAVGAMALYEALGVKDMAEELLLSEQQYDRIFEVLRGNTLDTSAYVKSIEDVCDKIPRTVQWLDDVDAAFNERVSAFGS